MELGVDIIAVNRDGHPCAFQLKTGKISLKAWREISSQVFDLVYGALQHPSITDKGHHLSFLVTNSEIEEEAQRAINDFNETANKKGFNQLRTIVGGQLFRWAMELEENLWPTELSDTRILLEIHQEDGKNILPKDKFSSLLEKTIILEPKKIGKSPRIAECSRSISSGAVLCAIATFNYSNQENHVAVIEAWTIYIACVLALAERYDLQNDTFSKEIEIAQEIIFENLMNLIVELRERDNFTEGHSLVDSPFYRIRVTWILSYLCIFCLWNQVRCENNEEILCFCKDFILENLKKCILWGEGAVPHFLSIFWSWTSIDATLKPVGFLLTVVNNFLRTKSETGNGLPNPYYQANDLLPYFIDNQLNEIVKHPYRLTEKPLEDNFVGRSYFFEGLIHLVVKRGWKQFVKSIWSPYSKIMNVNFEFKETWQFFRWRNREGIEETRFPKQTKEWKELYKEAIESEGKGIPSRIKNNRSYYFYL